MAGELRLCFAVAAFWGRGRARLGGGGDDGWEGEGGDGCGEGDTANYGR